ncbi:protein-export membrane protein SecF [Shewanella sp. UCD-FRSSP16_17]|uniref:protein translocase subunit SecF n=2 Tax=unclassified Shewanella TaxID=196818 RepID=UPI0007EE9D01|nr:protein translocase subunit SecF [Shewanella sp. MMG014]MBQ4888353.1 protein translocase subunit SecF [Shewanella sp. MMG014]OBT11939.1 protein-export membrane protein SecF [Shewanella sp. UCD-FRSSP16_17]
MKKLIERLSLTAPTSILTQLRCFMTGISLILLVVSMTIMGVKGFNWGLDFTGGVVAEVAIDQTVASSELKAHLDKVLKQDVQVTQGAQAGQWTIRYNHDELPDLSITQQLLPVSDSVQVYSNSVVGPQVGQEMVEQGGLAVIACLLLIMVYLSMRFDWRLASGALMALITDIVIVLGVFSLFQLEFNLTVLAALLAVLGYSLNDSIIIADRVRELMRMRPESKTAPIIDDAVKATFSRTLVTSGTTLVTVSSLWLLAGDSLQGFSVALFVGIVCGTCSSVALGVTLPQWFGLKASDYIVRPIEVEEGYT